MMIPIPKGGIYESVEGVDGAAAVPGIEDVIVTAKQGQRLIPLPEGSSYLGFIFARGRFGGRGGSGAAASRTRNCSSTSRPDARNAQAFGNS